MKSLLASRRGSALVVTLSLLVALTLLVVGMTMLMRTEQKGAAMLDREMASRQLAQIGPLRVIATLRDSIPATLDNNRYYASMPGMVVGVDNSPASPIVRIGLLYSNGTNVAVISSTSLTVGVSLTHWMTVTATADKMFNINWHDVGTRAPIIPINNFYTINASNSLTSATNLAAIQVGWQYVTAPSDNGTVVIGRFAYWTDDEAAKININAAWRRSYPTSTLTVTDTSSIDLRSPGTLGAVEGIAPAGSIADNIRSNRPAVGYYTPEHIKFVPGMTTDIYERNKFYLTNFGTPNFGTLSQGTMSPGYGPSGFIILMTGLGSIHYGGSIAGTPPLSVGGIPNYGTFTYYKQVAPIGSTAFGVYRMGTESELDNFQRPRLPFNTMTVSGFGVTMNPELYARLSSTASVSTTTSFTPAGTWTKVFPSISKDFIAKYPMVQTTGHLLVTSIPNAGGFQLMANLMEFTRGSNTSAISAPLATTGTLAGLPVLNNQLGYLGLKRTAHLNEVIANGTATTEFDGFSYYAYYSWRVQVEFINPYNVTFNNYKLFYNISYDADDSLGAAFPNPGAISGTATVNIPPGYSIWEIGMSNVDEQYVGDIFSGVGFTQNIYLKVNQLRLMNENGNLRDYLAQTQMNALKAGGRFTVGMDLTVIQNIDPEDDRNLYNAANSVEAASRADAIGKDDPRVPTVWQRTGTGTPGAQNSGLTWNNGSKDSSENGVVLNHSTFYHKEAPLQSLGELGYIHTGIPWRTLRMQPRSTHASETDAIPDWALWDIFKLGPDDYKTITPVTGRININQRLIHASSDPAPLRLASIFALLGDINGSSFIANNHTGSLSASMTMGAPNFTQTGTFGPAPLAGAILEVPAVTNNATTDAGAEHIARLIAPLVTARTRQFTVYSVGQTIIDVNRNGLYDPGIDIISGETRLQTVIERDPILNVYRIIYQRPFTE
jgi:hypothetical protein